MTVLIRKMTQEDAERIAAQARDEDRKEAEIVSGGRDLVDVMNELREDSFVALAAYVDGDLVCCYGSISRGLAGDCNPWMVATPNIRKHWRVFVSQCRGEALKLVQGHKAGWNVVWDQNKTAIRWLKWLGFTVRHNAIPFNGYNFYVFGVGEGYVH